MNINHEMVDFPYEWKNFPNYGYLILPIPETYLNVIKTEMNDVRQNKNQYSRMNSKLVGQLKQEYEFNESLNKKIEPFLKLLVREYELIYGKYYSQMVQNVNLEEMEILSCWVNFQKKHEYNPPHNHSGLYSFAAWLEVPYDLNDELNFENSNNSLKPMNSLFSFQFINSIGQISEHFIHVDKSKENHMIFFPSIMNHFVNPFFTSENERVSIAGNLGIKNAYKK